MWNWTHAKHKAHLVVSQWWVWAKCNDCRYLHLVHPAAFPADSVSWEVDGFLMEAAFLCFEEQLVLIEPLENLRSLSKGTSTLRPLGDAMGTPPA